MIYYGWEERGKGKGNRKQKEIIGLGLGYRILGKK